MEIKRVGSQASAKGPAEWFTGRGADRSALPGARRRHWCKGLASPSSRGARTAWQQHRSLGQTLIVTAGLRLGAAQMGGPAGGDAGQAMWSGSAPDEKRLAWSYDHDWHDAHRSSRRTWTAKSLTGWNT